MSKERDNLTNFLDDFIDAYLDYREGEVDEPPTLNDLTEEQRQAAESYIKSITDARGIDPYASRPSIEQLLATRALNEGSVEALSRSLQAQLRTQIDAAAIVMADVAAEAAGLASELLIRARGMRIRAVVEQPLTDLDAVFLGRVGEIAAVFGAFPDTSAVLYATTGSEAVGVLVERSDVHSAIETPSGENEAPRLRRPVMDAEMACALWLREAIPEFDPVSADLVKHSVGSESSLNAYLLATDALDGLVASGRRARIETKREAWVALGDSEVEYLAAIVTDALGDGLPGEEYRRRLDDEVEIAA